MADLFRVNVAKLGTFLEKTDEKPAVYYVRLAQNRRERNDAGQWVDGETRWLEARFTGKNAELMRDDYAKGDPLLVFGTTERRSREHEGKQYTETVLYVDAFAPDPRRTTVTIDRAAQANRAAAREAAPKAEQTAAPAGPEADPGPTGTVSADVPTALPTPRENEEMLVPQSHQQLGQRCSELLQQGRISASQMQVLADVPTNRGAAAYAEDVRAALQASGVEGQAKWYLASPSMAVAGVLPKPYSWADAGNASNWEVVQQAKEQVQQPSFPGAAAQPPPPSAPAMAPAM